MDCYPLEYYDEIIISIKTSSDEDMRGFILPSLHRLKVAGIHQDIDAKYPPPRSVKDFLKYAETSIKIRSMLAALKDIEQRV